MNECWCEDQKSLEAALALSREFFSVKSGGGAHQITACGHCHIDTAWLWTYSETRRCEPDLPPRGIHKLKKTNFLFRKCARSWSNQLTLMKEFPKYIFTASQAQVCSSASLSAIVHFSCLAI